MNLAHETDLLLWEETTVIDETGATFCVVFPLLIIERFDPEALAFSASIDRPLDPGATVGRDYFFTRRKLPLETAV